MLKKKSKPAAVRNEDYYRAMVEIRRSSATQRHTLKQFKGSRSTKKSAAIREAL